MHQAPLSARCPQTGEFLGSLANAFAVGGRGQGTVELCVQSNHVQRQAVGRTCPAVVFARFRICPVSWLSVSFRQSCMTSSGDSC